MSFGPIPLLALARVSYVTYVVGMSNAADTTLYVNVYRTGGTVNFKWVPAFAIQGRAAADKQRQEIRRMGYPCYTYTVKDYETIGGPDTFDFVKPEVRS